MSVPQVSVLMTTRNGAAWIGQSLQSVLTQTLDDLELVVVDDASSDATPAILAAVGDKRLRVLRQEERRGIAGGRNLGLAACRAPYVAVLDHDDVSLPGRLAAQAAYLDAHPGTVLVGTGVRTLRGERSSLAGRPAPAGEAGVRLQMHLANALTWSSVMFRRSALEAVAEDGRVLRQDFEPADDFDLYHRLMLQGNVARLDAVLTEYRWHAGNTTYVTSDRMAACAARVLGRSYAAWFGDGAEAAAVLAVRHLSNRVPVPDAATLDRVLGIIGTVAAACGDPEGLAGVLRWEVLRAAVRRGRPGLLWRRGRFGGGLGDAVVSGGVGLARSAWRRAGGGG